MKTSRIGLRVLVLLLLAFVVATPTAFAEALSSDGGSGGSSTAGWSPSRGDPRRGRRRHRDGRLGVLHGSPKFS